MQRVLMPLFILFLLSSCGRIPEPVGYEYTTQPKMQAAYHWTVLASDVANRINNQLILSDYPRTPVYVRASCGDEDTPCNPEDASTFTEAFRDLLITELVRFGVPVRQTPDDESITVHYKVQLVYHHTNRVQTIYPGMLTSLTAGIMVLRNAPHEIGTIAAAGLIDLMNASAVRSSNHEVIITTSMIAKDRYLHRTSDIYYINDKDSSHYRNLAQREATEIQLVGPAGHTPSPVQPNQMPVVESSTHHLQPEPIVDEDVVMPNL